MHTQNAGILRVAVRENISSPGCHPVHARARFRPIRVRKMTTSATFREYQRSRTNSEDGRRKRRKASRDGTRGGREGKKKREKSHASLCVTRARVTVPRNGCTNREKGRKEERKERERRGKGRSKRGKRSLHRSPFIARSRSSIEHLCLL